MKYIKQSVLLLASTIVLMSFSDHHDKDKREKKELSQAQVPTKKYWPNGAQLVISVSMQFETGGQPEGAESPFSGTPCPKDNLIFPQKAGTGMAGMKEFTGCWIYGKNMISK
ncbi:hypothetical protein OWR28_11485 [Chryseobacterium sp. 1B4]